MINFRDLSVIDLTSGFPSFDPDGLFARYYQKRQALRSLEESFEDDVPEGMDEVTEALTLQQRVKRRMIFRKNRAKIMLGRERAKRRHANKDVLMQRATRQAKDMIARKLLSGKSKGEVSFADRARVEKLLAKRKNGIKRLAMKLLPKVREKEQSKFSSKSDKSSSESDKK